MPVDADDVADIEEAHERELLGRKVILVTEDLDLARRVVEIDEHAAVAHRADAAGDRRRGPRVSVPDGSAA